MSKFDAERALNIYKNFSKQTNQVVEYLSTARSYENATRLEIPKLKHAPTSLTGSLEEYLQDPDFEINRRQYLAQQEAKKGRKNMSNGNAESSNRSKTTSLNQKPEVNRTSEIGPPTPAKPDPKGPAPDLIDLFDSIEQNQQPMATQAQQVSNFQNGPQFYQSQQPLQQPQLSTFSSQPQEFYSQNGLLQQQTEGSLGNVNSNPFGQPQSLPLVFQQPAQQNFTTAQFGSYAQQPFGQQQNPPSSNQQQQNSDFSHPQSPFSITQHHQPSPDFSPQQTLTNESQQQSTNPFRQSIMPQATAQTSQFTNAPPLPTSQPYQSTNPFARNLISQQSGSQPQSSPFTSPPPQTQPTSSSGLALSQPPPPPQNRQPTTTGTNPFARNNTPLQQTPSPLISNQTGSTNPFRQSTFGPGWTANQGTMGGLEHLETVPVFPRPGQQPQEHSQGQGWP